MGGPGHRRRQHRRKLGRRPPVGAHPAGHALPLRRARPIAPATGHARAPTRVSPPPPPQSRPGPVRGPAPHQPGPQIRCGRLGVGGGLLGRGGGACGTWRAGDDSRRRGAGRLPGRPPECPQTKGKMVWLGMGLGRGVGWGGRASGCPRPARDLRAPSKPAQPSVRSWRRRPPTKLPPPPASPPVYATWRRAGPARRRAALCAGRRPAWTACWPRICCAGAG